MIIDEISEVLSLMGVNFPPNFRDSLPDLGLIIFTYLAFIALRRLSIKMSGKLNK